MQVETLDEDIALLQDILRLPDTESMSGSSSDLIAASSDHVHNGDTKIRTETGSARDKKTHFTRKNKSYYEKTFQQYDAMLTDTERDLIYTAYFKDYLLFGFEANP